MKQLLLCLLLFISFSYCYSQVKSVDRWKSREIKYDDDLLLSTTWLICYNPNGQGLALGTGYYFKYQNEIFIVTNKHVVEGYSAMTFDISRERGTSFTFDSLQNRKSTFFSSNDEEYIDLAIIKISNIPYLNLDSFANWKAFNVNNLPTKKDIDGFSLFDEKIVSLSYPGAITTPYPIHPIIFTCYFASKYSEKVDDIKSFYLNGVMTSGASGSPIVSIKGGGKYLLLGTYYLNLFKYDDIDSVEQKNILTNGDFFIPKQFKVKGYPNLLSNYKVVKDRFINVAVKSEVLLELLTRK